MLLLQVAVDDDGLEEIHDDQKRHVEDVEAELAEYIVALRKDVIIGHAHQHLQRC